MNGDDPLLTNQDVAIPSGEGDVQAPENQLTPSADAVTDWFLQELVDMANYNDDGEGVQVTLVTHGFMQSGQLISGPLYFKLLADEMSADLEGDVAERVRSFFNNFGEGLKKATEDGSNRYPPNYYHLKNARCFHNSGAPVPNDNGVLIRGRIREVASFWHGNLVWGNDKNK